MTDPSILALLRQAEANHTLTALNDRLIFVMNRMDCCQTVSLRRHRAEIEWAPHEKPIQPAVVVITSPTDVLERGFHVPLNDFYKFKSKLRPVSLHGVFHDHRGLPDLVTCRPSLDRSSEIEARPYRVAAKSTSRRALPS